MDSASRHAAGRTSPLTRRVRSLVARTRHSSASASLLRNISAVLILLTACSCQPGQNAASSAATEGDKAYCAQAAHGNSKIFANCLRQMSYARAHANPPPPTTYGNPPQQTAYANLPPAPVRPDPPPPTEETLKYTRLLDRLVAEDSKSWAINRYKVGSMRDVTIEQDNGSRKLVKGFYIFDNGSVEKRGWVEAQFVGGHISCFHYWDRVDCRPPGEGLGKQLENANAEAERERRQNPGGTCRARCERLEADCQSRNSDNEWGHIATGGFNMKSIMWAGITAENCGGVRSSCLRDCGN